MSNLTRIFLCLTLSLSAAAPCLAQQKKRTRPTQRRTAPAPVREEVIVIAPGPVPKIDPGDVRQVGQATVTYTPSLNQTSVGIGFEDVYRRGEVSVWFECSFGFEGREPVRPDEVHWSFVSDWTVFKKRDRLVVNADGKTYQFTPKASDGLRGQRYVTMDFASFERIANSKRARVSFGQVVFDLDENQREAMRDMLKVLEAPAR